MPSAPHEGPAPLPGKDPLGRALAIAPQLRAVPGAGGQLFLIGEHARFVVHEPLFVRLLAAADGQRSGLELVAALEGEAGPMELLWATSQLIERGYLAPVVNGLSAESAAWWQSVGIAPAGIAETLATTPVSVLCGGRAVPDWLTTSLVECGLRVEAGARHTLILCDDYLDPVADRLFEESWNAGGVFLPLKANGRTLWLGPAFSRDGGGPCWHCLRVRLQGNRPVEMYLAGAGDGPEGGAMPRAPDAALAATRRLAACIAGLKIAEALVEPARTPLRESLLTVELPGLEVKRHRVVRRPQCPACGDPEWIRRAVSAPVRVRHVPRLADQDGGHRVTDPEETFARCAHLVSPVTGVVMHLAPFEGRDHPLRPVYAAGYHLRPAAAGLAETETFFRPALGKGRTPAQARASALAEAIERHASLWQGDEPVVRGARAQLGAEAADPRTLLHFSDRQYAERGDGAGDWRHTAPLPFSDTQVIDWVPCWSLTHDARRYLPLSYCFNQTPEKPGENVCPFDPNGHAAGNCREEAILQAFLELVERDAVGIWWYNRLRKPGVELESSDSDYFSRVRAHYHALGWTLWSLDLTTDLAIPVVAALARHEATGRFVAGFGCHLDPTLALQRAVTEAHQLFDPSGAKPAPWSSQELDDPRFVSPREGAAPHRLADLPRHDAVDLRDGIELCVARARACGLETIVLDYSRPDLVLATVKVVVPGLRHFWRRLGPGRLYDVPVRTGELERPLREEELNPLTLRL